jgi:plasmid stabilization system protein ParE
MAQRKIIWSHRAKIKLYSILEFYADRNKTKAYSAKLYARFNNEIKLLAKHPNLGIKTEIRSVRGLIVGEFIIYYESQDHTIIIHTIWDSRQNPDKLTIK